MPLVAGTHVGPYEILGPIGAGGMGEVYRARDSRLGRDVALKILPESFALDHQRLHRFEQESRAVATFNHPNILAIHDVGQHNGSPYLVSELLEGESLRAVLDRGAVLRQDSMRTENSAFLCRDGCPVSVIPSPSSQSLQLERPLGIHVYITMEECGRFRDATLVRIRQPDRTGGAALRVAPEKECDPRLWRKFCRSALPSRVQGACGPRGSSGHTRRGVASDGVHRAR